MWPWTWSNLLKLQASRFLPSEPHSRMVVSRQPTDFRLTVSELLGEIGLSSHREGDYCQLYLSMIRLNSSFPSFPYLSSLLLHLLPTAVWPWLCGKLILGSSYENPSQDCVHLHKTGQATKWAPSPLPARLNGGFTISATLPIAFEDFENWSLKTETANLSFTPATWLSLWVRRVFLPFSATTGTCAS